MLFFFLQWNQVQNPLLKKFVMFFIIILFLFFPACNSIVVSVNENWIYHQLIIIFIMIANHNTTSLLMQMNKYICSRLHWHLLLSPGEITWFYHRQYREQVYKLHITDYIGQCFMSIMPVMTIHIRYDRLPMSRLGHTSRRQNRQNICRRDATLALQ